MKINYIPYIYPLMPLFRGFILLCMCLHPTFIKNPNKGSKNKYSYLKDTTSDMIPVPCGHCSQCIYRRQMNIAQRVYLESLQSDAYYITLTYNNNVPVVDTPLGAFKYPSYHDLRRFIKRLEKFNTLGASFKYIFVSEYGTSRHRPHFHGLFFLPKITGPTALQDNIHRQHALFWPILNQWTRNIGSTRSPQYIPLCTYKYDPRTGKRNYDFQYLRPKYGASNTSNVTFYITKYMTKYDTWFSKFIGKLFYNTPEDQFKTLKHLISPKTIYSKTLGLPESDTTLKHIRKGIDLSLKHPEGYYKFIMPDGSLVPLSPFYKTKYVTIHDAQNMYMADHSDNIDSYRPIYKPTPYEATQNRQQNINEEIRFKNIQQKLDEKFNKKNE